MFAPQKNPRDIQPLVLWAEAFRAPTKPQKPAANPVKRTRPITIFRIHFMKFTSDLITQRTHSG
jgi:hypothetical protein